MSEQFPMLNNIVIEVQLPKSNYHDFYSIESECIELAKRLGIGVTIRVGDSRFKFLPNSCPGTKAKDMSQAWQYDMSIIF